MIRLLSTLDGEAKRTVDATDCNKCSHAQPLQLKNAWVVKDLQLSASPVTASSVKKSIATSVKSRSIAHKIR